MTKLDLSDFLVFALAGATIVVIAFVVGYLIGWSLYNMNHKFRDWVDNIRHNDSTYNYKSRQPTAKR